MRKKDKDQDNNNMYLKVEKGSRIYDDLYSIFTSEENRFLNYVKWMRENLPSFGNKVLVKESSVEIYPIIIAWKIEGDVNHNIWQPYCANSEYYVPKLNTLAGKVLRARLIDASGKTYFRLGFFELFDIDVPLCNTKYICPTGFVEDEVCFMMFDDAFKLEIKNKMHGNFIEISRAEWKKAQEKNAKELERKLKEVIKT